MWTGVCAPEALPDRVEVITTKPLPNGCFALMKNGVASRNIPVRSNLEHYLREYLAAAGLLDAPKDASLFLTSVGKTDRFTENSMNGHDICRMVKCYALRAGLPDKLSPHSFRVSVANGSARSRRSTSHSAHVGWAILDFSLLVFKPISLLLPLGCRHCDFE